MILATAHAHGAPVLHQIVIAIALTFSALCTFGFIVIGRLIRRRNSRAALRARYARMVAPDLDGDRVLTVEQATRAGILCRPLLDFSGGFTCATCGLGPCRDRGQA